jgi:hypothetical protein
MSGISKLHNISVEITPDICIYFDKPRKEEEPELELLYELQSEVRVNFESGKNTFPLNFLGGKTLTLNFCLYRLRGLKFR